MNPEAVGGARKPRRDAGEGWCCSCRMVGGGGKRRPGGEGQQVLPQGCAGSAGASGDSQGAARRMYPAVIERLLCACEGGRRVPARCRDLDQRCGAVASLPFSRRASWGSRFGQPPAPPLHQPHALKPSTGQALSRRGGCPRRPAGPAPLGPRRGGGAQGLGLLPRLLLFGVVTKMGRKCCGNVEGGFHKSLGAVKEVV